MKHAYKLFFLVMVLAVTVFTNAQLSTPSVESVYGGRINTITGIALSADTSRIFVTTESANTMFYADVYANTSVPSFGTFTTMPGVNAAAGYGLNVRSIAAHEPSGNVYFCHQTGLLYSHPSSSTVNTVMNGNIQEVVIKDDVLLFIRNSELHFGTLDAAGAYTASTGSPLNVSALAGWASLVINPLTDTLYAFVDAAGSPSLIKFDEEFDALNASTSYSMISLSSLSTSVGWTTFGIGPDGRLFIGGTDGLNKHIAYSDDEVLWSSYQAWGGVTGPNFDYSGDSTSYYVYFANVHNNGNGMSGSWDSFGHPGGFETHPNDGCVFTDPVNDAIVYMTTDQGIGASYDYGETINEINDGIEAVWTRDFDMTVSEYTGWLASKSGIRKVEDFKGSPLWTNAIFPNGDGSPYYSAEIDQNDTTTVYAGNVRVYKTTDDGNNWTQVFTPENAPYNYSNIGTKALCIEVCDYDNNIVFAGFEVQGTDKGGLFYTTDGGSNWDQILLEASSVGFDVDVSDVIFNLEGSDTVAYVSAIYDLSAPQGRSVYKLTKSGNTWTPAQDFNGATTAVGYAITATIWDVDVSPTGDTVYAAGTDAGTNHPIAYYKPLNTTALWTVIPVSGFPVSPGKEATAITVGIDTVYAAVDNEVYYYPVGATSWTLGYTYPVGTRINFLYYDELLVGTDFGMFGHLGTGGVTSVNNEIPDTPDDYKLYQNYPNPFNPNTNINYYLKDAANITLKVYDILGKEVAVLYSGYQNAGQHSVNFNTNEYGLSSGMYIYTLNYNGIQQMRKMILLK